MSSESTAAGSGGPTFLGWPRVALEDITPGMIVVTGAPCGWTGSGPGPEFAPDAIRRASRSNLWRWTEPPEGEVVNVLDGTVKRLRSGSGLGDLGDITIHSPLLDRTTQSISDTTFEIARRGGVPVTLGGDHYISFPAIEGVARARGGRIGYIQVDAHLDLQDHNPTHGTHWHGSNARRVSELDAFDPATMVWFGLVDVCWPDEWAFARDTGCTLITMQDIRRSGLNACVERALAKAAGGTDAIYLTIDIDVVQRAASPGTGYTNFGGLTAWELLEVMALLSAHPQIAGIDLVEVNPLLDVNNTTAMLASLALSTLLAPRVFEPPLLA
jgi:agmatinase